MTEPLRRRHHVVPRFYLKQFAKDGQVRVTWQPGDRSALISIDDASVRKDFYNVTLDLDGAEYTTDYWERMLSEIEGRAAAALREIVEHESWPLHRPARAALTWWIAVQYLRGVDMRRSHDNIAASFARISVGASGKQLLLEKMEAYLDRQVGAAELDAEWAEITKPGGPTIRHDPKVHLATLDRMAPEIAELLDSRTWAMVRFEHQTLLTSDTPVVVLGDGMMRSGIANADQVAIPIGRDRCLILFLDESGDDFRMRPNAKIARAINEAVIHNAREWVIAHPDDDATRFHSWHSPHTSEGTAQYSEEFIDPDAEGHLIPPEPPDPTGQRIQLRDYEWPIEGHVFVNPYREASAG